MSDNARTMEIGGYTATLITVGKHTLGHVSVDDDITVVFRMNDTSGGPADPGKCLACQISKVGECARVVCPDIKEANPNASCYDAIRACMSLACQGSCAPAPTSGDISIFMG